MSSPLFADSASGIRPAGAFALLGMVFVAIALWVGRLALRESHAGAIRTERDPAPEFSIVDRDERPLAEFVQRLDLVFSPNALWQAHTPEHLIDELGRTFGRRYTSDQLRRWLFPDAEAGVIRCRETLNDNQARALNRWIQAGTFDEKEPMCAVEGFSLLRDGNAWRLCWRPELALSAKMRTLHVPKDDKNPLRWSRKLADGIARAMLGDNALKDGDAEIQLENQRTAIWRFLMPTTYAVALHGFDPSCAPRLFQVLNDEGVLYVQMHIARQRDRVYPMGELKLLGAWGFIDWDAAKSLALKKLGIDSATLLQNGKPTIAANFVDRIIQEAHTELAELHPVSGLELLAGRELDRPTWANLERRPASYTFERHTPLRRKDPLVVPRTYFIDSNESDETPRVVTTLDAFLEKRVGEELDQLMARNKPAIGMAIVVDLASGDVLAVDSREAYPFAAFAPIKHQFTPGSTTKVLVMAAALDQGVVQPDEDFNIGNGHYVLGPRIIREADNPKISGHATAAQILAYSVNAGMVQIGPRVDAPILRQYFLDLGYGRAPQSGLGPESSGYIPALPWKPVWTHASVSFGHELSFTLWQHAAGLATVIRGGEYLPLRLVDAIEQGGTRYTLPRATPRRVFKPETCAQVREMMKLGASEGTGSTVARPEVLPEIEAGTKTGTAQKTATEICFHTELAHQQWHAENHTRCSVECRKTLAGKRPHLNCYTSSMCAFGRVHGSDREVMVLVVADEPMVGKYGSLVAGPTAIAILKEALGVTRLGEVQVDAVVPGFAPSDLASVNVPELPWAHAEEGAR